MPDAARFLLGRERRATEGADLPLPYEVGQDGEALLDVGRVVGAMHLVQVDAVRAQAAEALLDRLDECLDLIGYKIGIYEDVLDDAAATSRGRAASPDPRAGPGSPAGGHPAAATGG